MKYNYKLFNKILLNSKFKCTVYLFKKNKKLSHKTVMMIYKSYLKRGYNKRFYKIFTVELL